jgi:uncharacterized protein (DUF1330 family)
MYFRFKANEFCIAITLGFLACSFACCRAEAQTTTPAAYWVTEALDVMDQAGFANAVKAVAATVQARGGRYIVRGGKVVPGIGSPPSRITIIAFDSLEKAEKWYNDPAAVAARTEVQKYAREREYTVQGVAN